MHMCVHVCACVHAHSYPWEALYETAFIVSLVLLHWYHDPPVSCFFAGWKMLLQPISQQISFQRFQDSSPGTSEFSCAWCSAGSFSCFSFLTTLASVSHFSVWCLLQMNGLVHRPGLCRWADPFRLEEEFLDFFWTPFLVTGSNSLGCQLKPSLEHCWWLSL